MTCEPVPTECRADQWQCQSGQCIAQADRCNRRYDCRDGSDETDCRKSLIRCISLLSSRLPVLVPLSDHREPGSGGCRLPGIWRTSSRPAGEVAASGLGAFPGIEPESVTHASTVSHPVDSRQKKKKKKKKRSNTRIPWAVGTSTAIIFCEQAFKMIQS